MNRSFPTTCLYKVMTGKYFSVNVVRWGNLPIFMQVANAKIADGMFCMTVLGIIMLGGLMDERYLCDGQAVCPWHGRCFGPVLLGSGARDSWRYLS